MSMQNFNIITSNFINGVKFQSLNRLPNYKIHSYIEKTFKTTVTNVHYGNYNILFHKIRKTSNLLDYLKY